jgi:type II secretory pathway predicted ATPase ExeA
MQPSRRPPSRRPFMTMPRLDFYHPASDAETALEGLERAIRRGEGIGLLVGAAGTGKTLLLSKLAEQVRNDFQVAMLSGARICTRRALWQSILAEIDEPYRGLDEGELRIGIVERVRGLAATGSGLVILVDEAQTLPKRLLEEIRLLMNIPVPLPAVHIVLAGTILLEEILSGPKFESVTQRIAVRGYLEPLDHAETAAYLRTQMQAAGLDWEAVFEPGCEDAVYSITEGIPRLVNQLCDQALLLAGGAGSGRRVAAADLAAAWREIQRLPLPPGVGGVTSGVLEVVDHAARERRATAADRWDEPSTAVDGEDLGGVIEFGCLEDDESCLPSPEPGPATGGGPRPAELSAEAPVEPRGDERPHAEPLFGEFDPWRGPEVELVFDPLLQEGGFADTGDPFAEYFDSEEKVVERFVVSGPVDFGDRTHVASREGESIARQLPDIVLPTLPAPTTGPDLSGVGATGVPVSPDVADDDSDMLLIEEDEYEDPDTVDRSIVPVRLADYSRLFMRLRRGEPHASGDRT